MFEGSIRKPEEKNSSEQSSLENRQLDHTVNGEFGIAVITVVSGFDT